MRDSRKIRIVFGRDRFQMELVEDRFEGIRESVRSFFEMIVWYSTWLVTGIAIANAIAARLR